MKTKLRFIVLTLITATAMADDDVYYGSYGQDRQVLVPYQQSYQMQQVMENGEEWAYAKMATNPNYRSSNGPMTNQQTIQQPIATDTDTQTVESTTTSTTAVEYSTSNIPRGVSYTDSCRIACDK